MKGEERKQNAVLLELREQLIGEHVLVRPYAKGDGGAVWEAVDESREHLRPWMPWVDSHKTPGDSEAFARSAHARWLLREDLTVGFWEPDGARLLGGSGLHRINWELPSFEIGYWVRKSAEGKGYVGETVRLLCGLAFRDLEASRVFIRCDSVNSRSANVARRSGFTHEGTLRSDARTVAGELRDTMYFGLTRDEYFQAA